MSRRAAWKQRRAARYAKARGPLGLAAAAFDLWRSGLKNLPAADAEREMHEVRMWLECRAERLHTK